MLAFVCVKQERDWRGIPVNQRERCSAGCLGERPLIPDVDCP